MKKEDNQPSFEFWKFPHSKQNFEHENITISDIRAKCRRLKAEKGLVDASEFPLLLHIDEIITQGKPVDIPWEKFTFEK